MADVTGRISSLPGSHHSVPSGSTCDEHPDILAVARVQGETDSMGSEMHDLCQACYDEHLAEKKRLDGGAFEGSCDRCKSGKQVPLFPWRDSEEGSCGPVYYYCRPCKDRIRDREQREYAQSRNDNCLDYY